MQVNVIKLALECSRAEYAGFRRKVEEADGFSVLLAANPCLVPGAVETSGDVLAPPAQVKTASVALVCRKDFQGNIRLP